MNKGSDILQRNIEEENRLKEEDLLTKVNTLKTISLDIQTYMTDEKKQLTTLE
jgi:hypothetical protein